MKWDIDRTEGVLWIGIEAAKALLGSMKKELGIKFTVNMGYTYKNIFDWCTLEKENKKVGFFLVKRFKNEKFRKKFVKDYKRFYKNTIKKTNKFDKIKFSKLTNDEVFKLFKKINKLYIKNFDWGFIIEPMDFVMPELIETLLKKQGFSQEEIADLLAISDISFLNKEMQELINIAKQPKCKQIKLLKKHAYKYRWIQSAHIGRKDIPFSYFKDKLKELKEKDLDKELNQLKNFESKQKQKKKKILKGKKVNKETKILLNIAWLIAPFHDKRKELFLRTVYAVDTLRGEIAKRYGYTKGELAAFSANDLLKLKKRQKIDKKYARAFAEEGLFYSDTKKGIWKIYSGKKARKFFEKELKVDLGDVKEIKGMSASLGKAKGRVKIIYGFKDMHKIKKGNVLVTSMTRPEHVPLIKKVVAIVTDEGGVTCHAAIISRELGIPCIIGTKIATQVFKDDDLVEVDANKGIVRKIK